VPASRLRLPVDPPRGWPRFDERLRALAVTARLGRVLGIAIGVCFVTGLLSHYQYQPWSWLPEPAHPSWGYRFTQGVHVTTGIASIPLLLVKLWSVYPRLFAWPPARSLVHALERLSVGLLVAVALIELTTGFLNVLAWYPWPWPFVAVHRLDTRLYYKRLAAPAYKILCALRDGRPLEKAISAAGRTVKAEDVREWFGTWMHLGWFCHPE